MAWRTCAPVVPICAVSSKNYFGSVYIDGAVNDKALSFSIDAGATRIIVRSGVMKNSIDTSHTDIRLSTATGEVITTKGETLAKIGIGSKTLDHLVLVADIADDFILGMDFLSKRGVSLDLEHGVIRVGNEESFIHSREDGAAIRVILAEDTTIPGRSEKIVMPNLEGDLRVDRIRTIEPVDDQQISNGVLVGKSLVRGTTLVPVRIMSVNPGAIRLKKGTTIGRCTPVSHIDDCVVSLKDTTYKDCPKELQELIRKSCHNLDQVNLKEIQDLVARYQDVFATANCAAGRTEVVTQHRRIFSYSSTSMKVTSGKKRRSRKYYFRNEESGCG